MDVHCAVKTDNLRYIRQLVPWENVNLKDKFGKSPLYYAVEKKNLKILHLLLMFGSNVNISDNEMKTPLHYVEDAAVAQALIDKGANVNATDKYGRTPLHYADNFDIVRLLLDRGADVNAIDNESKTPLHYADLHNVEIAEILIKNGANVNALDEKRRTPLHYENKVEIVEILLNNGANSNAKDHEGKTPLFKFERVQLKFVQNVIPHDNFDDYIEVIRLLVEKGANIHCKDNSGSTVLHYAAKNNDYHVILCLLDLNAEVYCKNKCGKTPLEIIFSKPRSEYYCLKHLISRGICDLNLFKFGEMGWMENYKYILLSFRFANFYLEEEVLNYTNSVLQGIYFKPFQVICEMEIKKLKCTKIDKINSYYDFIKMNDLQLEKYVRNKKLHKVLSSDNFKKSFPIYSPIITAQYKKLFRRSKLLDKSIPVLLSVGNDFTKLPDCCIENIFKYLDNDDLVNILQ